MTMSEREKPAGGLLKMALRDREKRPWRYYRLEQRDLMLRLDKYSDLFSAQHERITQLEAENARLRAELAAYREEGEG